MGQNYQLLFIVWRESVEALLVVGILHAWLKHGDEQDKKGLVYLWSGVCVGLLLAVLLGLGLQWMTRHLEEDMQAYVQVVIMLLAAILIVQMVFWMRCHGAGMRQGITRTLQKGHERRQWWGVFMLAMLAVAREGSEMVVFMYGIIVSQYGISTSSFWYAVCFGLILAWFSFMLLQAGGKVFSWRRFFRVTEIMLLFLAAGLFLSGMERVLNIWLEYAETIAQSDILYKLMLPVWDSSAVLREDSITGVLIASLTGYRATPSMYTISVYLFFWGIVWYLMRRSRISAQEPS